MKYLQYMYDEWLSCPPQVNPPYFVKLVELVPHPETTAAVVDTTHALMTKVKIPCYAILGCQLPVRQNKLYSRVAETSSSL